MLLQERYARLFPLLMIMFKLNRSQSATPLKDGRHSLHGSMAERSPGKGHSEEVTEIALETENYRPVWNMNPHSCKKEASRLKLV